MRKLSLKGQAEEILKIAEERGVQGNFFFITTFKRYQVLLQMLNERRAGAATSRTMLRGVIKVRGTRLEPSELRFNLERALKESGTLVTKEYVKGRKNLYDNPAINAYNRTTDSANRTVRTIMKIINGFDDERAKDEDPLLKMINGGK